MESPEFGNALGVQYDVLVYDEYVPGGDDHSYVKAEPYDTRRRTINNFLWRVISEKETLGSSMVNQSDIRRRK